MAKAQKPEAYIRVKFTSGRRLWEYEVIDKNNKVIHSEWGWAKKSSAIGEARKMLDRHESTDWERIER